MLTVHRQTWPHSIKIRYNIQKITQMLESIPTSPIINITDQLIKKDHLIVTITGVI
jgi:hypothetical protein